MKIKNKIQDRIVEFIANGWPLPEYKPSGKSPNLSGDRVLLLLTYSTEEELQTIKTFVANAKNHIAFSWALAFNRTMDTISPVNDDGVFLVTRNDFSIFGKEKKRLSKWLLNNDYELLISFDTTNDPFLNGIISKLLSHFKVGIYNRDNYRLFDLTIKQETEAFDKQLELFIHYLEKLNINK